MNFCRDVNCWSAPGLGFGSLALAWMFQQEQARAATTGRAVSFDLTPKQPHFQPKAKAVIQLMQNGGPSQMDLLDPKPLLSKLHGKKHEEKLETLQEGSADNVLMGSPYKFEKRGQCGMDVSELLPHTATIVDEITLIRSMYTEHNNHSEALVMLQTGKIFPGRPTTGAWISYALGNGESESAGFRRAARSGRLQHERLAGVGQRLAAGALSRHGVQHERHAGPESEARDARSERLAGRSAGCAGRAESSATARATPKTLRLTRASGTTSLLRGCNSRPAEVLDLQKESEATKKMYGLDNPVTAGYGIRCLMARRLVEAGVRFVQVFPPVRPSIQPWDNHSNLTDELPKICSYTDLGGAALVKDLKERGLLDDVVVMWAGEFGRLPISQKGTGRDHNRFGFSLWMAGGGFKKGYIHGATDDIGYRAVENKVSVPELHATLFNQLGLDHKRVTYRHHGREESLTDTPVTHAEVVSALVG